MKVRFNCLFICILGFSFTQIAVGYWPKSRTIKRVETSSPPLLGLDEAYLLIRNTNYSDNIIVLSNVVVCEHCDYEELAVVLPDLTINLTISTRFPYNIQIRRWPAGKLLQCQITSYRFAEHGTYLFEIIQTNITDQDACSITQIGQPSYFWTPVILGIFFLIAFIIVTQFWHIFRRSRHVDSILTRVINQESIDNDRVPILPPPSPTLSARVAQQPSADDDIVRTITGNGAELPLVGSTVLSNNSVRITKVLPKRLRALDTFRGFSLMVMIFVNYGGGGYWFFDHSIWNGLTLADLVFPWFVWMMGVSIVLSQRSLRAKNVRRRSILLKICRRTAILFVLGLASQGGGGKLKDLRILGVLQRLALCYFLTALIVLIFDFTDDDEPHSSQWAIGNDVHQPLRIELANTVLHFWPQWLFIALITLTWILVTFFLEVPNCPRGYVGPGGKHDHGKYQNCTGGAAGYIDRLILRKSHMYNYPTCREVYNTQLPFDPEGILGILTGTLLCYLGVQAGHSFAHSTRVRRVCAHWIVSGIICGFFGLLLSKGGHSDGWIPINKNLWSLTFIFVLSSLAFIILTILYLLVDVYQWFTGAPFLWLGMNSILIYMGHELFSDKFPVQFGVDETHAKLLAMHLYGASFWAVMAGLMYHKKFFIAI